MRARLVFFLVFVGWLARPTAPAAATPACDGLAGTQRTLAQAILKSQHAYACCDSTLDKCLKQRPVCRVVERLANDICRRVAAGEDRATIERALARRATSMMPSAKRYDIDLSGMPVAGDPASRVTAVLYICPRCPYCAKLAPELYRQVSEGSLKGKVKLYVRPFPLRSHPQSTEASMAWMAAIKLGKFWPYLLHLYKNFDKFDPSKLPDCAAHQGMNREAFLKLVKDSALRSALVKSKKEGVRNGVDATPTVYINTRKYVGDLDVQAVVDVLEEEHDRVTGKAH